MSDTLSSLQQLNENIDLALGAMRGKVERAQASVYKPEGEIYPGDTVSFIVSNYDNTTDFTVAAGLGNVNLVDLGNGSARIDYIAPTSGADETLVVNGRTINFTVQTPGIAKPSIVSLVDGQVDVPVGTSYAVSTTAFESKPAGQFTHSQTDWQIATDMEFTNIVWDGSGSSNWLESAPLPNTLSGNTTYYIRVRHVHRTQRPPIVYSEWSDPVQFTTASTAMVGNEIAAIVPGSDFGGGSFGEYMDMTPSGNIVIASALRHDDIVAGQPRTDVGAIGVYVNAGEYYSLQSTLLTHKGKNYLRMGAHCVISDNGEVIVTQDADGTIYIFGLDGMGQWALVTAIDYPQFAVDANSITIAVSPDGTRVALGHSYANYSSTLRSTGKLYMLHKNGGVWTALPAIDPEVIEEASLFGMKLSFAPNGQSIYVTEGAKVHVYVFDGTGWGYDRTLPLTLTYIGDIKSSADGTELYLSDSIGYPNYKLVVVDTATGTVKEEISAPDGFGGGFSGQFDIDGDATTPTGTLIVGAKNMDSNDDGHSEGGMFLYTRSGESFALDKVIVPGTAEPTHWGVGTNIYLTADAKRAIALNKSGNYSLLVLE